MRALKLIIVLIISGFFRHAFVHGLQALSKSKLESCDKDSDSSSPLNCSSKIVIDLAVPSESSGKASIVAEWWRWRRTHLATCKLFEVRPDNCEQICCVCSI